MAYRLGSRRLQKRMPATVVAINKLTGTQYGYVMDAVGPIIYIKTTKNKSYYCIQRSDLDIVRPELVLPYCKEFVSSKTTQEAYHAVLKRMSRIEHAELAAHTVESRELHPTITAQQCDRFIKGYVPVKVFVDYDSFLSDFVAFVNGVDGKAAYIMEAEQTEDDRQELKRIRKAMGRTLAQQGSMYGVSAPTVQNWETGKTTMPSALLGMVRAITQA